MPRSLKGWEGASHDTMPPPRVFLRRFECFGGRCAVCTRKLRPGHWELDHITALINGGENVESNLQPLCEDCHKTKSRRDIATKAYNAKVTARHLGIKRKRRTIPGRKFNGTPIPSRYK